MKVLDGVCHGGPLDGLRLQHWDSVKTYYRPMLALTISVSIDKLPVEAVPIGEYRFLHGEWRWFETEVGRSQALLETIARRAL